MVNKEKIGGNTSGKPQVLITTGATEYSKVMNIYDIAGNVEEWTLEKTSITDYPCAGRGGSYDRTGSNCPAAGRIINSSDFSYNGGFRVSLF